MSGRIRYGRMEVAASLHDFINGEVLPGLGFDAAAFWAGLEKFLADLAPRNRALLEKRDAIQARIDAWHRERKGQAFDAEAYRRFLTEIGYLVPRGENFSVETAHVDPEITMPGRTPARRSDPERSLCAQRRQCALGLAL